MSKVKTNLKQTTLSNFFSGIKGLPSQPDRKFRRKSKVSSVSSTQNSFMDSQSSEYIKARPLARPIFDEDNDQIMVKSVIEIKLNKPIKKQHDENMNISSSTPKKRQYNNSAGRSVKESSELNISISHSFESPKKVSRKSDERSLPIDIPLLVIDDDLSNDQSELSIENNESYYSKSALSTPNQKINILQNEVISPGSTKKEEAKKEETKKEQSKKETKETEKSNVVNICDELIHTVMKTKSLKVLLDEEELDLIKIFSKSMNKNYKYFLIKLFLWLPKFYNIHHFCKRIKLSMSEKEIAQMFFLCEENGFVDKDYFRQDSYSLLNELPLKDVKDICRQLKIRDEGLKEDLIQKLLKNTKTQLTLSNCKNTEDILKEKIREKMGHCIRINSCFQETLKKIYLLNTFTNFTFNKPQDYFYRYEELILPTYTVYDYTIFTTRDHFNSYFNAWNMENEFDRALENKNKIQSHLTIHEICAKVFNNLKKEIIIAKKDPKALPFMEKFSDTAKYISLLTRGAKILLVKYTNEVLEWLEFLLKLPYCSHKRYKWITLAAKIYAVYQKKYSTAALLIIDGLQKHDNFDYELQEIATRGRLLFKKSYKLEQIYHDQIINLSPELVKDEEFPKTQISCRTIRDNQPGKKRHYVLETSNGRDFLTVEEVALEHYFTKGFTNGCHTEGRKILTAFNLLFWDCIYEENIKGVFVSKKQNLPLDMYTEHFYKNRVNAIKRRVAQIEIRWSNADLKHFILDMFNNHANKSSLCNMAHISDDEEIYSIIMCVGRELMSKIFLRLATHYQAYHSGFPDLLLWNTDTKKAKFVEVKGENDKLSIKQKLWIKYLISNGADVEVCHVHSIGSKKKLEYEKL